MSRIGKQPVIVPQGVEVTIKNQTVTVKGKLGMLSREFHPTVTIKRQDAELVVESQGKGRVGSALWGLSRALLANMVTGVAEGFTKNLEIQGVGYRAQVEGNNLKLALGFSHDVLHPIPDGLTVKVEKNTLLSVSGHDREVLGQFCAEVRSYRPPEPYKGKGVRYQGEYVLRKEGKKK